MNNPLCNECNGTGWIEYVCPFCSGEGACGACDDAGEFSYQCEECDGTGVMEDTNA